MPIDSSKHEIRLVEILPGNNEPESTSSVSDTAVQTDKPSRPRVRCGMRRVSLDDAPVYTGLSYVWGDSNERSLVLVDDREVSITTNLESALFHLRHASTTITLWIDALCINQSDDREKSASVQKMTMIYQNANHVIVWLGPTAEDSDVALTVLNQIGKEVCDLGFWDVPLENFLIASPNGSETYEKLHEVIKEKLSLDLPFQAIARFTCRPWWYRVWTLQEFVLARAVSFACGFSSIETRKLAAAILIILGMMTRKLEERIEPGDWQDPIKGPKLINIFTNQMNPKSNTFVGVRRRWHTDHESRETLIQLLRRANAVSTALNNSQATDSRDRIFGMLGMASDTDQLGIRPDYSKTCQQVYTDAARALLQHGHTDVLVFSQFPKKYTDLPTWVPDWTTTIQEPCGGCIADAQFYASGGKSVEIVSTVSPDAERLIAINGVRVDMINQVATPWLPTLVSYHHDWEQSITFVSEIGSFCDQSDHLARPIYRSSTQREEAVWRILCGDFDRFSRLGRSRARATGPDLLEGFKLLKAGFTSNEARDDPSPLLNSYTVCMGDMFKRRPFLSAQGYVGLAPSHAEVGDVIAIIYGAIVPFVLRELANGQFELVGEAYVHGIMDGEFVEDNPSTETFVLC